MATDLMREYARTAAKFEKAENELTAALDKLEAARDAGDASAITTAYMRAQRAELDCSIALGVVENARRAVWLDRARQAEAELERMALPLLSVIRHCHRAGGAMVSNPDAAALSRIGCMSLPPVASNLLPPGDRFPPIVAIESLVLDRAEESNITLLRGGLAV